MKLIRTVLAALLALAVCLEAQLPPPLTNAYYVFTIDASLAGAAAAWSVAQSATPTKNAVFVMAMVTCPTAACKFTLERDGASLGTSSGVIARVNPNNAVSTLVPYAASTATVGTLLATYELPVGGSQVIDVNGIMFSNAQTGRNLTIRAAALTGEVIMTLKWYEQ
jgi:hypothetical protein